jgi:hypothetical protein
MNNDLWLIIYSVKEKLPFPAEMFDFVHIRFVARGVPEDVWSGIFKVFHHFNMIIYC